MKKKEKNKIIKYGLTMLLAVFCLAGPADLAKADVSENGQAGGSREISDMHFDSRAVVQIDGKTRSGDIECVSSGSGGWQLFLTLGEEISNVPCMVRYDLGTYQVQEAGGNSADSDSLPYQDGNQELQYELVRMGEKGYKLIDWYREYKASVDGAYSVPKSITINLTGKVEQTVAAQIGGSQNIKTEMVSTALQIEDDVTEISRIATRKDNPPAFTFWDFPLSLSADSNVTGITVGAENAYVGHQTGGLGKILSEMRLLCPGRDIDLSFPNCEGTLELANTTERDSLKRAVAENIKAYYDSPVAQVIRRSRMINYADGTPGEGFTAEPSYYTGKLHYVLNGGTAPESDTYIIGKENAVPAPARTDYKFCGWYTKENFAANTILPKKDGCYMLSAAQCQEGNPVTLYARWEFHAVFTRDGLSFLVGADRCAVVTSCAPSAGDGQGGLAIPDRIMHNGYTYPVVAIGTDAFRGQNITAIVIPETIHTIGENAFADCRLLTDVYMESDTLTLGENFNKSVHLHAYADTAAYRNYDKEGYTGKKTAPHSVIRYMLDGGKNNTENPGVYYWRTSLILKAPVKEGYRFDGWFADQGWSEKSRIIRITKDPFADMDNIREAGEITVYAKWTKIKPDAEQNTEVVAPAMEKQDQEHDRGSAGDDLAMDKKEADALLAGTVYVTPAVQLKKVKNIKGRKLKVSMALTDAKGAQVQCSTGKKFAKKKTKNFITKGAVHTIKNLIGKQTYYIRARAYAYDAYGRKYYSQWTKAVKITVKK